MPVTARLSKAFYEQMGEQVTNELVAWFNSVDDTYRTELKALNELNFARFDAKLDQRVAELRAEMQLGMHGLRADMQLSMRGLRTDMQALKGELIKWMFLFWAGTALAGLLFR